MQLKETFILIGVWRPKMSILVSKQERKTGRRGKRKEKKRKKEKQSQGMEFLYGYMTFAWILVCFLYTNYLGMIARVFLED